MILPIVVIKFFKICVFNDGLKQGKIIVAIEKKCSSKLITKLFFEFDIIFLNELEEEHLKMKEEVKVLD